MTDRYQHRVTIEDVSVGDEGPELVVEALERRDFVRYAGASGDFNPIHYDEPYAIEAGNPSVFAQGMLIHGFASHMVSDWFGLDSIRSFRVRFQEPTWPGDTICVTGQITDVDGSSGIVEADVVAENQDETVVLSGSVTASLPTRSE